MPIVAVCPSCKKQYQVNEKSIGKSVRCKNCQNVFTVQDSAQKKSASKPAAQKVPAMAAAGNAGGHSLESINQAGKKFGLNPLPKNPNWSMPSQIRTAKSGADPLAAHVVTDPGFPYISAADYQPPGLLEEKSIAEQYMEAAEEDENENAAGADHGTRNKLFSVYATVLGCPFVAGLTLLGFGLTHQDPSASVGLTMVVIVYLLFAFSIITLTIYQLVQLLTYATTMEVFLSFVVPFFYLYVVLKYFEGLKHAIIMAFCWPFAFLISFMGPLIAIILIGGTWIW